MNRLLAIRCRKCRAVLVDDPEDQILFHDPLESGKIPHFSSTTPRIPSTTCTSFFIKRPNWLDLQYGQRELTLNCPRCESKVGTWSWRGFPCSCGSWIVPGFSLTKSKIDTVYSTPKPF